MGVPVLQLPSSPLSIAICARTILLGQAPVDDFEIFRLHRHGGPVSKTECSVSERLYYFGQLSASPPRGTWVVASALLTTKSKTGCGERESARCLSAP